MDFIFWSSMAQNAPKLVVVSYDIACQWSCNLRAHCDIYGNQFGLPDPYVGC